MRRYSLSILALFVLPTCCFAQTGIPPFGSFTKGQFDLVNNGNANVIFSIPIVSSPGRKLDLNFSAVYNSQVWVPQINGAGAMAWAHVGGWLLDNTTGQIQSSYQTTYGACGRYGDGGYTTNTLFYGYKYIDPLGTVHPFDISAREIYISCTDTTTYSGTYFGYAADGSGYYASISNPANSNTPTITTKSGTVISTSLMSITDTNGNFLSGLYATPPPGTTETDWIDTVGRRALKVISGSTSIQYKFLDPSGSYQTTTANLTPVNVKTNFGCSNIIEYSHTDNLLTSLVLPDGQTYQFSYEPTPGYSGYYTGRVQRVTLPTGGYYEYHYPGSNDGTSCSDGSTLSMDEVVSDGTNSATWNYRRVGGTTTLTVPQLGATNAHDIVFTFNGPQATQQKIYKESPGVNVLRTINTTWGTNKTPTIQVTILEDGTTQSETDTTYDSNGLLTSVSEYDWGSSTHGPLLRTTTYTYQTSTNYTNLNIINLVTSQQVKDGSGTVQYRQDTTYDGTALSNCPTGAPQHNDAGYPCSFNYRGNPTAITTYLTPATPANGITANVTFDWFGNPLSVKDPLNNTTAISYTDAWGTTACNPSSASYAYPTSITNALNQTTSLKYYACDGLPYSTTDPNNQTASFVYDSLLRLTQANSPDGGQTTLAYNSATSTTSTTKMNASQNIVSTTLLDSLGRTSQTQLNSDTEGVDYTSTTYDLSGRISTVSNPYRSTSDPTYGISSYQYDTLGRPTLSIPPDGSSSANNISTVYSTNTTTVTDQAGKKRSTTIDALGRLTQVTEDPGGLGYVTSYSYDVLNNLKGVTQNGGRQRTYVYDALSRLTSETNPESGTTNYYYATSGGALCSGAPTLVCRRTDARNITTTFSYDSLNRLTSKSYSDGTPSLFFSYDIAPTWMSDLTNVVGRLVEASNQFAGVSGSSASAIVNSYDAMGRIVRQWQQTPSTSPGGNFVYQSYNFAGHPISSTSAAGVTISYAYDAAGRPATVTSSWIDAQHPATLATVDSAVGYYPHGAIRKMTLANGLTQTAAFNITLQPCRINVNSSGTTLGRCGDAVPSGNLQDFSYGFNSNSANNGNVVSWAGAGRQIFNRSYTYDGLNRLSTLASPADPASCTGLSWTYDPWGNRTDQNVTAGTCTALHATVNTNNQLIDPINNKYQYDAAGNMVRDNFHTYTYDAENHLTAVDAGATANYVYDASGQRVRKNSGASWTEYFYDVEGSVTAESIPSAWPMQYVYLNGGLIAQYSDSTTYSIFKDHLGSTRLVYKLDRSVAGSLDFLPFGQQIVGGSPSRHKFTGDERDAESNLDHTQFRQYSSALARWMNPDPAGRYAVSLSNPQTWNRYAYVTNNPSVLVDPSGLCPNSIVERQDTESEDQPSGMGIPEPQAGSPINLGCPGWGWGGGGWGGGSISIDGGGPFSLGDLGGGGLLGIGSGVSPGGGGTVQIWTPGACVTAAGDTTCDPGYFSTITLPTGDPSGGNSSWLGTFTKTFVSNFFSPSFYKQELQQGGCLNTFVHATGNALIPTPLPSVSTTAGAGTLAVSAAMRYNAAQAYAASRTSVLGGQGLIFPQKSIPYNNILKGSAVTSLAEGGLGYVDGALFQGLLGEAEAAYNGNCH